MYGLENVDFGAIDRHYAGMVPMHKSLEQEASEAIKIAKSGAAVIVTLQAIATLAALGIFLLQAKQYSDSKRKSKRSSRRSR